ncbi:helix-turn-helix domain-containing protein [Nocardioides sp. MAHUQ-72]|uniref:helix-turn-helix transcriptional regulator n=1 Tax=unclassified Nocardioides TaxID=2615069 RepID=UPI00361F1869
MTVGPVRLAVVGANDIVSRGVAALVAEFPGRVRLVPYPPDPEGADPDVVLYDVVHLHTGDGHDFDLLVKETSAAVLVLAREPRPDLTACALARGADAWVSLEASSDELLQAVESAAAGGPDEVSAVPAPRSAMRLPSGVNLSARELEMLVCISEDLRNSEIAERFYLSVNSVKTYIRSAYRKIGVNNRAQAVLWCVQHGIPQQHPRDARADMGRP